MRISNMGASYWKNKEKTIPLLWYFSYPNVKTIYRGELLHLGSKIVLKFKKEFLFAAVKHKSFIYSHRHLITTRFVEFNFNIFTGDDHLHPCRPTHIRQYTLAFFRVVIIVV